MKAKGVVFTDRMKVEFREIEVPEPGPNDVVTRTHYSWISNGTEGSFLRGERIDGETPYVEGGPWPFPIAMGYQSTGVVESVGANVNDLKPGQMIFGTIGHAKNLFMPFAGHIDIKVMDRSQVWALPEGASPIATSGLVLTQVGYNCGNRPPVLPGDPAVVIGDGMVGQWAAQTLHLRGADVLLVGKHDDRLKLFAGQPCRNVLNIRERAYADGIREFAPNGAAILVDTVGTLSVVRDSIDLMRHDGHLVSAGYNHTDSLLDIQKLRFRELTFHSPSGWQPARMDETLRLVAGGYLQTEPLITHRFPAAKAAEAWDVINSRRDNVLGVLLEWQ